MAVITLLCQTIRNQSSISRKARALGFAPLDLDTKRKGLKGFTLIELLVVIVIIGIMASLAIPRLVGHQETARVSEAISMLSAMRRGQEVFFNENSAYQAFDAAAP